MPSRWAARQVLGEFGGLHILSEGAGVACARSDLNINPSLAKFEEDRFFSFYCLKGKAVFPLGEAIVGHFFAAIDEGCNVYLVMQEVRHVASSFEAALENLL
ncbi:MAG: SUKH-3 domain-containing protein, partial [Pyrinomonadaceae bacterium]